MATAATGESIHFEGERRLVRQLKKLSAETPELMKVIHKEAAEIVAREAAVRSPRRSGLLADSIASYGTVSKGTVRIGSGTVPYAGPIIYGWPARNISPNPFVYKALDARRQEVIDLHAVRMNELVTRTIKPTGPD